MFRPREAKITERDFRTRIGMGEILTGKALALLPEVQPERAVV